MSFLSRLMGGNKITPESRESAVAFLVQLNAFRARQDDEAAQYNGVLAKFGGSLTAGSDALRQVAVAARHMAEVNNQIVRRYRELGPIPDVAGRCHAAWWKSWLLLEQWSSRAAAAYEGMYEGATPPRAAIQQLLVEEQMARQDAVREEAKLLRRLGVSAEEARQLVVEGERTARNDQ